MVIGSKVQNVEIDLFGAMTHIEVRRVPMNSIFQVLTLSWSLSGGVLPDMAVAPSASQTFKIGPQMFAEYAFELSCPIFSGRKNDADGIFLGTEIRNQFVKASGSSMFDPLQDTYTFSAGVRWDELTVGFDHSCTHSIENLIQGQIASQTLFGAMDRVYVKLAGKI
jgi:hypothetical protein